MQLDDTPAHGRRITVLVALMTMLAPFSIDTYLPSFPDIAREFGASHLEMQQTMSLYLLAFAVTSLIYGPLADAFGRRIVVLYAIGLYSVASVGCALSETTGQLILFRIAQGLTASAGFVVGRATVRDAFQGARAQKATSNVMVMFALAPAIAPVVGGYLHDMLGWRSVFWFLALMGATLHLLIYLKLPETLSPEHRHSIHPVAVGRVYGRALSSIGFMLLATIIGLNFGGMFLYVAGAPSLIYDHLGFEAGDFATLFIPLVAGLMLGALTAGQVAGRIDMRRSAALGFGFMAVAAVANLTQAFWLPIYPLLVIGPVALYAFGNALAVPSLSLLAIDYFPKNRGMASSAQGFVHTGFNALVAGALVPLASHAITGMAVGMTVLNCLALSLWLAWLRFFQR